MRPRKEKDKINDSVIQIYVSASDAEIVKRAADKQYQSVSAYCRQVVIENARSVVKENGE